MVELVIPPYVMMNDASYSMMLLSLQSFIFHRQSNILLLRISMIGGSMLNSMSNISSENPIVPPYENPFS